MNIRWDLASSSLYILFNMPSTNFTIHKGINMLVAVIILQPLQKQRFAALKLKITSKWSEVGLALNWFAIGSCFISCLLQVTIMATRYDRAYQHKLIRCHFE